MADTTQLQAALVNADKAGDTEAAKTLAAELRRITSKPIAPAYDAISQGAQNFADEMSFPQQMLAGAGKAFSDIGTGVRQLLPGDTGKLRQGVAEQRRLDAPLMATPGGRVGELAGNVAATVPALAIPGVNTVPGAAILGGAMGLAQPSASTGETTANVGIGAALGGAGQGVANKLVSALGPTVAKASDATLRNAQDAGYVLPPSMARPGILNNLIEGIAGKIKTAQKASFKNQEVTNSLAKEALGIAPDAPLNANTLQAVRQQAGQAYAAVANTGRIVADEAYTKALDAIKKPFEEAAKDFPKAAKTEVIDTVNAIKQPDFAAASAIEQISLLRNEADKAYRSGDKMLGKAIKGAATALEDQVGRHVESLGNPELLSSYQKARELIAKSYSVQGALDEATGNVSARVLARQLDKGRKLSGGLELAGRTGQAYPKAVQEVEKIGSQPSVSPFDLGISGIAATAMHNPSYLATMAARPMLRSAILSKSYQAVPRLAEMAKPALQAPARGLQRIAPQVAATTAMEVE